MIPHVSSRITVNATLVLDEGELRALDALVGYGTQPFLDVFYKHLGKSYMEPHEPGLRRLFKKIRENVPSAIAKADMAREFLKDN